MAQKLNGRLVKLEDDSADLVEQYKSKKKSIFGDDQLLYLC